METEKVDRATLIHSFGLEVFPFSAETHIETAETLLFFKGEQKQFVSKVLDRFKKNFIHSQALKQNPNFAN